MSANQGFEAFLLYYDKAINQGDTMRNVEDEVDQLVIAINSGEETIADRLLDNIVKEFGPEAVHLHGGSQKFNLTLLQRLVGYAVDDPGTELLTKLVVKLLKNGADPSKKNEREDSAIFSCHNFKLFKLLAKNCDLSITDERGNTLMHQYVLFPEYCKYLMMPELYRNPSKWILEREVKVRKPNKPLGLAFDIRNQKNTLTPVAWSISELDECGDERFLSKLNKGTFDFFSLGDINTKMISNYLKITYDRKITKAQIIDAPPSLEIPKQADQRKVLMYQYKGETQTPHYAFLDTTALHIAAQDGQDLMYFILLWKGADDSIENIEGITPKQAFLKNFSNFTEELYETIKTKLPAPIDTQAFIQLLETYLELSLPSSPAP